MMKRYYVGSLGEKLARDFLKKKGYTILETNYRCRQGEIDIVARFRSDLVFFEVRTKSNLEFGSPEEALTSAKIQHLKQAALHYCQSQDKMPDSWRIDLVAVELDRDNKLKRIDLLENAIEE
jgi:putative endonuclease